MASQLTKTILTTLENGPLTEAAIMKRLAVPQDAAAENRVSRRLDSLYAEGAIMPVHGRVLRWQLSLAEVESGP